MMTAVAKEGPGWDLLVERAIKWPDIELHRRPLGAVMKQVDHSFALN